MITQPIGSAYHLSFDDEFNGTSLDTSQWLIATNNPGPGAYVNNRFNPANVAVSNGSLDLSVTRSGTNPPYNAGFITTGASPANFHTGPSYIEARIKMPDAANGAAHGLVPAFWGNGWYTGGPNSDPPEIDMIEWRGHQPSQYWPALMQLNNQWPYPTPLSDGQVHAGVDLSLGFHVYGTLWTPTKLTFYLDGNVVGTITNGVTSPNGIVAAVYSNPISLILNNTAQMNGENVDASTVFPAHMLVDYVHVYSSDPSVPTVTPESGYVPGGDGTPVPAPSPSPNGTTITSASASPIIDQAGNAWTLVQSASQGLQIAINGIVDPVTSNVVLLEILNGKMLQENTSGYWYSEPGSNGPWTLIATPAPVPASVTTGTGSDTLVLTMSEDAYQGDAQFTVSVDGIQLAGIFTATASHASGASQTFTFKGDWAPGAHTVAVNFLNDLYAGTAGTDRNLYVNGINYDGTVSGQSAALMSEGPTSFSVTDSTAIPSPAVGSGSDTLVLSMSEDAYKGNAQFTVAVDGKQLGGIFTATTLHSSGGSQAFTFKGDFGASQHAVVVNFLNDAYAGKSSADRNLYVNGISYNGTNTGQSAALMSTGPKTFTVSGGTTPSVSETGDHGSLLQNLSQAGTYTVGGDTFVLSTGNAASATLGTGSCQIKFIGASSVTLTGGSGQATVTADAGNNKFVAGTGSLDVTGGGGKDAYVDHANSGLLTIEDFSLAKGDTLTIDKSLQGSLHQESDGQGGTLLTFGTGTSHSVDIHGIAVMPTGNILWA